MVKSMLAGYQGKFSVDVGERGRRTLFSHRQCEPGVTVTFTVRHLHTGKHYTAFNIVSIDSRN